MKLSFALQRPPMRFAMPLMIGYSLTLIGLSIFWGLARLEGPPRGFCEKLNWLFFPLYWPIAFALVSATWDAFIRAWRTLGETRVIFSDNAPANSNQLAALTDEFTRWRIWLIVLAVVLALALNVIDAWSLIGNYWWHVPKQLNDPDFTLAWYLLGKQDFKFINGLFVFLAYLGQVILAFLALLSLLQIAFHTVAFGRIKHFRTAKEHKLEVVLNYRSKMNEFGLEHWNYALNNLYWIFSACLLIPLLSKYSQPNGNIDAGQIILRILVPILIGIPMVLTVLVRQLYLRRVWQALDEATEEDFCSYHNQKIWPLDRNWSSKLGIVIAFVLLSYLIGSAPYELLFQKISI